MLSVRVAGQTVTSLNASSIVASGRDVVLTELNALAMLADSLGEEFAHAVDLLLSTEQRVIVSGMGKSGHIGRKIAATLASTGTPAFFVHPAEAAHGDLGMIIKGDLLLILSNSGNTSELQAVVRHAQLVGCPIIVITSHQLAPLAEAADVRLVLPRAREACPVNIAPTTSTTLALALGDALAIAAMRVRGLTRERLRLLHPGGAIGGRLATVETIMHAASATTVVDEATPMSSVVIEMSTKGFGIAGVVRDNRLVGAISDGDLRRHSSDLFKLRAADVMCSDPKVVTEGTFCEDALRLLQEHRITALFVTAHDDPWRPIGLVHIHDLTRICHA